MGQNRLHPHVNRREETTETTEEKNNSSSSPIYDERERAIFLVSRLRPLKSGIGFCLFIAVCLLSGTSARALVTDFMKDHTPVLLGQPTKYTAVDDGQNAIASYKWEYACTGTGCTGNYVLLGGNSPTLIMDWDAIGRRNIKLTVAYAPDSSGNPPPPNTVIIHWDDVLPHSLG